jgi:hypothetical protein
VSTPEPIKDGFTPEDDRHPGVHVDEALALNVVAHTGRSVPARLSLGIPKGDLREVAHIVHIEHIVAVIGAVVVELCNVEMVVKLTVIEAVNGHRIGTDRCFMILSDHVCLHMNEANVGISLGEIPLKLNVRVMPRIEGRGNILDLVVRLAEEV